MVLDQLTFASRHLPAWPDVPAGLARLRRRFLVAAVSNGNIALLCDPARQYDLRWAAILGADVARDYGPKAAVFLAAVDARTLRLGQCMMCAAHRRDLQAGADLGIRTACLV